MLINNDKLNISSDLNDFYVKSYEAYSQFCVRFVFVLFFCFLCTLSFYKDKHNSTQHNSNVFVSLYCPHQNKGIYLNQYSFQLKSDALKKCTETPARCNAFFNCWSSSWWLPSVLLNQLRSTTLDVSFIWWWESLYACNTSCSSTPRVSATSTKVPNWVILLMTLLMTVVKSLSWSWCNSPRLNLSQNQHLKCLISVVNLCSVQWACDRDTSPIESIVPRTSRHLHFRFQITVCRSHGVMQMEQCKLG